MKKTISILVMSILCLITSNSLSAQRFILTYGTEADIFKTKVSETISSRYNLSYYTYDLDIDKTQTRFSLSSVKLGYLTSKNVYIGATGSLISPLFASEEYKQIEGNLWSEEIDISNVVYGDGTITNTAFATYNYSRFFGINIGYDISQYIATNEDLILVTGISGFVHNRYFGEVVESERFQYYASGSQYNLTYKETTTYKNYSKLAASMNIFLVYKYFYLDISIGQVNSIGIGAALVGPKLE